MNIYIDENIPYAAEFFAPLGKLHYFSGRTVTAEQLQNADVLLVRSITQVNQQLLHLNKKLQFVGTATIGIDHVDQDYLRSRAVQFVSAPGCNKVSVAEYVLSALLVLAESGQFSLADKKVAIVGAGNTGSAVYQRLNALGIECLLYDPPLQQAGDSRSFCDFKNVLAADIISLHVPKIVGGDFPTWHMFDSKVLALLSNRQILINASRGEVIDNQALLQQAKQAKHPTLVLDVWENEPNIEKQLLEFVAIATPHIAGYSLDGKVRGTEMLYQALVKKLALPISYAMGDFVEQAVISQVSLNKPFNLAVLKALLHLVYDVRRDDALFRVMIDHADGFDNMRKNYIERRELSTLTVHCDGHDNQLLKSLGFAVQIAG